MAQVLFCCRLIVNYTRQLEGDSNCMSMCTASANIRVSIEFSSLCMTSAHDKEKEEDEQYISI